MHVTKRWLHWAGGAVTVLALVFVAERLARHAGELEFTELEGGVWLALVGLAVVYAAANSLLVLAWKRILDFLGVPLGSTVALRVYGISQLAKYVPGNIFHFAGRQALGVVGGLPGGPLAKSVLWELGVVCIAGGVFGALVISVVVPGVPELVGLVSFLAGFGVIYVIAQRCVSRHISKVFLYYTLFHLIAALVFIGVLVVLEPGASIAPSLLVSLVGGYVIAWLAGFMTPGAPAGVGIREAVLLFLFSRSVPDGVLLMAILLSRTVTVVGDTLFFGIAWWFGSTDSESTEEWHHSALESVKEAGDDFR